ncbi:MAG: GIY-YIG nuclease family protein [Patescibacteria group bacterium]
MTWYVYIAKCKDDTLYTGITTDIKRRELEHNADNKRGAKSLKSKRPIQIVYTEVYKTQGEARKREIDIKGWKRKYKLAIIDKDGFTQKNRRFVNGFTQKITK